MTENDDDSQRANALGCKDIRDGEPAFVRRWRGTGVVIGRSYGNGPRPDWRTVK